MSFEVNFFSDVSAFAQKTHKFLIRDEIKNVLLFSILEGIKKDKNRFGDRPPRLITIESKERLELVALQTPPYDLVISYTKNLETIDVLSSELIQQRITLPGALGFSEGCNRFITRYPRAMSLKSKLESKERIHKLTKVNPQYLGKFNIVKATNDLLPIILDWVQLFTNEAIPGQPVDQKAKQRIKAAIKAGNIFLIEDHGKIVSMARMAGNTPHGRFVNLVYTPLKFRRKGYATTLVAEISQRILDEGNDYACLFTDLANPTSNHIYQKIGYRSVMDVNHYKFK